jgi:hypothetical protein
MESEDGGDGWSGSSILFLIPPPVSSYERPDLDLPSPSSPLVLVLLPALSLFNVH